MKDVLTHAEISVREGLSLQKGMNFRPPGKDYSILLMSVQEDSPYNDGFDEGGERLIYEGEDVTKRREKYENPKEYDQPLFNLSGLTNNGKFFKAAEDFKFGRRRKPERVRVYEKISNNVWSDKGWFDLTDAELNFDDNEKRKVFKFLLNPEGMDIENKEEQEDFEFSRRIPTEIKRLAWERDEGKCITCGSDQDLHFDHIIPFSKGGSSRDENNIQILCSKHNLSKSDKII